MRIFLLIFFTTFNFSLFAQNVSVTLMVDMQNQTVSSSGVYVAGGFNSWSTNTTPLSDVDGDQVYEVTLNLSANSDMSISLLMVAHGKIIYLVLVQIILEVDQIGGYL